MYATPSANGQSRVRNLYSRHSRDTETSKKYGIHSNNYDVTHVYGARSNFISSIKSNHDALPLISKERDLTRSVLVGGNRSNHSSAYRPTEIFSSYNANSRKQSPPRISTLLNGGSSNTNIGIVRPPTKERSVATRNISNATFRIHSSSELKQRDSSLPPKVSPANYQKSNSSSDVNSVTTRESVLNPSLRMPPKNSTIHIPRSSSLVTRAKEQISINDLPYKDTSYEPSFASSKTSALKESSNSPVKLDGDGNTGLKNIGNTCFMNSMLQCLSNTIKLRDYCLNSGYITELNSSSPMKGKLIKAFADLLKDLWSGSSISVNPTNFKSQIQKFSPRFMGYEQQDSQEFLRFLLEGLHEEINRVQKKSSQPLQDMTNKSPPEIARETWKWYELKDKSFIFDLFVGQLESSLVCLECGHESLTYDPFWDLSLPISKGSFLINSNLDDCLRNFTKEELLDKDEKPTCEKCRVRRKMKKKLSIHRFPKILVIHLKRFNEGSRYRQKLSNLIVFPVRDRLHLRQFSSKTSEDVNLSTYNLYAVSNHCGSCYGGHYTAYCLNPALKQWLEYNDSRVASINESSLCSKEAYVLFYAQTSYLNGKSSRL